MPPEVVNFITANGYWAIFVLVFSQEIGLPNPVPNELVMLFCGYLAWSGILSWPYLVLVVFAADLIGTSILYSVFYLSGSYIMKKKPRWLLINPATIERLSEKIRKKGKWIIYLFRLTPFIRGYTSVISGLLQIRPRIFMLIAFLSAATWSTAYISTGRLLGPYINYAGKSLENDIKYVILGFVLVLLTLLLLSRLLGKKATQTVEAGSDAD
ncbi:MAG: DedA family protein [Bacteroidota bacterium]